MDQLGVLEISRKPRRSISKSRAGIWGLLVDQQQRSASRRPTPGLPHSSLHGTWSGIHLIHGTGLQPIHIDILRSFQLVVWLVLFKWTQLHCTATTLSCDEARGGFVHGVPWTLRPVHTECPGPAISRLHPSWQELAQERAKSGCGSPGALSAACPTSAHHSPALPPNCPNLKTLPGKCPSRNKPTHRTTNYKTT